MKLFSLKLAHRTIWRFGLVALFVGALLIFAVPWQRLKVPALILCLNHGTGHTRSLAAMHLGRIDNGDPKAVVPALLPHLKDKNMSVREMTAISLGHIHQYPEQVVPALLATINAEKMESLVPMYGYRAIGCFGTDARAWSPTLVQIIESNPSGYWANSARSALAKINPEVGRPLVEQYLADVNNRVKQAQLDYDEKQHRKALALTNPLPVNP